MSYQEVIHGYYEDLNNLSVLLRTYVEIYRLLISSSAELNATSISKKGEMKETLERINNVGAIIDDILKATKKCEGAYTKFCVYKNEVILEKTEKSKIFTEIDNDLNYYNN